MAPLPQTSTTDLRHEIDIISDLHIGDVSQGEAFLNKDAGLRVISGFVSDREDMLVIARDGSALAQREMVHRLK